jgi:hypothetical protein
VKKGLVPDYQNILQRRCVHPAENIARFDASLAQKFVEPGRTPLSVKRFLEYFACWSPSNCQPVSNGSIQVTRG